MINLKSFTALIIFISFLGLFLTFNFSSNYATALEYNNDLIYNDKIDVVPDNLGNFFILSYDLNKNETIISYFNASSTNPCLTKLKILESSGEISSINYKYSTVNYFNNSLYISKLTNNNTCTTIEKYTVLKDKCVFTNYLILPNIVLNSSKKIAVGKNDTIFIIKSDNSTCVSAYTIDGEIKNTNLEYNNDNIVSVLTDISGNNLYALTNSYSLLKYDISSNKYYFSSDIIDNNLQSLYTNYKFLSDNTLISSSGRIYNLSSSKFEIISSCDITFQDYPSCVCISGFDSSSVLAKVSDNVIYKINCTDGTATQKLTLEQNIIFLSCSKDKTIAITKNNDIKNIFLISKSDFKDIVTPPVDPDPAPSEPDSDNNQNQNDPYDNIDDEITSSINYIDYENFTISEINPGTTLAEFKNSLNYNGYNLSLTDAQGKHKSGYKTKVGTGNILTFLKDGKKVFSFTLIVKGDLTGTGTITSRDITYMTNYLLGKSSLEGVYLKAADINNDGEVNSIDLLLMRKMSQI